MLPIATWYASGQMEHDAKQFIASTVVAAPYVPVAATRAVAGWRRLVGHGLVRVGRLIAADAGPGHAVRSVR